MESRLQYSSGFKIRHCFKGHFSQGSSQASWIYITFLFQIDMSYLIPTVSPLLTPVVSRNLLLLQSLPTMISHRQDNVRRRKDVHRVGTAARGSRERLLRLPRRLPSDGGPSR